MIYEFNRIENAYEHTMQNQILVKNIPNNILALEKFTPLKFCSVKFISTFLFTFHLQQVYKN